MPSIAHLQDSFCEPNPFWVQGVIFAPVSAASHQNLDLPAVCQPAQLLGLGVGLCIPVMLQEAHLVVGHMC